MAETDLTQSDPTALVARLEEATGVFERGILSRWIALQEADTEWKALQSTVQATGHSILGLALWVAATAVVTYLLIVIVRALLRQRAGGDKTNRRGLRFLVATVLAFIIMFVALRFTIADLDLRRTLRIWVFAITIFSLIRAGLIALFPGGTPEAPGRAIARFRDTISLAFLWALIGIAINATARIYNAGPGLQDLIGTVVVALPVTALLVYAYAHHRALVGHLIAPSGTESRLRLRVAAAWPFVAILVLVLSLVSLQVGATIGRHLPPVAVLMTIILVLIAPHLDHVVARWSDRLGVRPDAPIVALALRRTMRFVVAIAILCLLIYLWGVPLMTAFGIDAAQVGRSIIQIGLIALAAAFLWNAVGVFVARVADADRQSNADDEGIGPRSRIGTLLPLLAGIVKISILSVTLLTILVAIGINVWPIIGGLSIFGIAIGFGSQTLVKDVVSGLFFLIDDAFRQGEYIETPGAKGTVEKISVRSVSLRNPRGALASVPYGQIGKVINFSRGWVIEKLVFRVAFDTDMELVRKLFKKIGQEISEDPEHSPYLLEPFKSQGIAAVEDGTLIIRGKFKARAGKQFAIKKVVLNAVQKAFRENGVQAVPRPLVPPTAPR